MTVFTFTFGWKACASPLLATFAICAGLHSRNMKATAAMAVTATTAKAIAQATPELFAGFAGIELSGSVICAHPHRTATATRSQSAADSVELANPFAQQFHCLDIDHR